jgi:hypothetical protein
MRKRPSETIFICDFLKHHFELPNSPKRGKRRVQTAQTRYIRCPKMEDYRAKLQPEHWTRLTLGAARHQCDVNGVKKLLLLHQNISGF